MDAKDGTPGSAVKADANGWAEGRIEPFAIDRAWSLFAPESGSRIDIERWSHHAHRFFGLRIQVTPEKRYPGGGAPLVDAFDLDMASEQATTRGSDGDGMERPGETNAGERGTNVGRVRVITVP